MLPRDAGVAMNAWVVWYDERWRPPHLSEAPLETETAPCDAEIRAIDAVALLASPVEPQVILDVRPLAEDLSMDMQLPFVILELMLALTDGRADRRRTMN